MTLGEQLQWILRTVLLLFILSSVAFLSALTAMRFAIQGREVSMPDVVGTGGLQAEQVLRSHHLGMKVEDRVYSSLPVDSVVRQSPPPSTRVKTGQYAHVVLSLGPQSVSIPEVKDVSLRAAQVELLRRGMQLGEISSVYLPDTPPDTVALQDPAPGTTNVQSPHVNLLVSLGPRPPAFAMPDLAGLTAQEAESKLGTAGLKIAKITPVSNPAVPVGTITNQIPPRGQRVDLTTTIELEVAQ
ncbi:MAG TPA: PASTA domain-containing protein [Candidatus Acidoferrum sp.]|nr:PASTA domain-containing protein [Candidatus Acidoferrum sp.]